MTSTQKKTLFLSKSKSKSKSMKLSREKNYKTDLLPTNKGGHFDTLRVKTTQILQVAPERVASIGISATDPLRIVAFASVGFVFFAF